MNDPLLVRRLERLGDLLRDRQGLVERDRTSRDPVGESSPSTSSITSAVVPSDFLQSVNGGDVRMVECGEHFGFTLKAREAIRISRHCHGQHLDGDLALQIRVGRAVDLAHPTSADLRGNFIRTEACAGGQSQVGEF